MAYGYTGQPLDANGLAYHRARYYDASLGVSSLKIRIWN